MSRELPLLSQLEKSVSLTERQTFRMTSSSGWKEKTPPSVGGGAPLVLFERGALEYISDASSGLSRYILEMKRKYFNLYGSF